MAKESRYTRRSQCDDDSCLFFSMIRGKDVILLRPVHVCGDDAFLWLFLFVLIEKLRQQIFIQKFRRLCSVSAYYLLKNE